MNGGLAARGRPVAWDATPGPSATIVEVFGRARVGGGALRVERRRLVVPRHRVVLHPPFTHLRHVVRRDYLNFEPVAGARLRGGRLEQVTAAAVLC